MNKRLFLLLATVLLAGGLLSACRAGQPPAPAQPTASAGEAQPGISPGPGSEAEPGSAGNPLVQALSQIGPEQPAGNLDALDRLLAEHGIQARSGRAASAVYAIRAICNGSADVAWLAAVSYVAASQLCPELQLVATLARERGDGQPVSGQFLVSAGSNIESLAGLAGRRLAFAAPNNIAGHLYPAASLLDEGVEPAETFLAGSDELALQALLAGEADAAVISSEAWPALAAGFPDLDEQTRVLATTAAQPGDVIVAAAGIPASVVAGYGAALQEALRDEAGQAVLAGLGPWSGVKAGDDGEFAGLRQAVAALGIDPANWKGVSVPYRVGLVTKPGIVDDGGLNFMAHEGLSLAARQYGVDYTFIETAQPADHPINLEQFARQGYDLVVAVDDTLSEARGGESPIAQSVLAVAQKYPGVRFAIVNFAGEELTEEVLGVTFAEDQAGFLAGALAGLKTQSRTVGFVGGVESPTTRRYRNGFENGARYVCGDCNVIGVYIDSFSDPARGRTAALSQIGEGADVIFGAGGLTGAGALTGAAEDGIFVIGAEEDQYRTTFEDGAIDGADMVLSSAIKRVDVATYDLVEALIRNNLAGGITTYEAANDGVGLAPFHETEGAILASAKAALEDIRQQLASGELSTGVDALTGAVIGVEVPEAGSYRP